MKYQMKQNLSLIQLNPNKGNNIDFHCIVLSNKEDKDR